MSYEQFLQSLTNGLTRGAIYALIALGYTMVYGILGMINFAHGEIYMIGAYVGILALGLFTALGWTAISMGGCLVLAFVVAMAWAAAHGVTNERVAYRPLRHAPSLSPLISAIGMSLFLQNYVMVLQGKDKRDFPSAFVDLMGAEPLSLIDLLGRLPERWWARLGLFLLIAWADYAFLVWTTRKRFARQAAQAAQATAPAPAEGKAPLVLSRAYRGALACVATALAAIFTYLVWLLGQTRVHVPLLSSLKATPLQYFIIVTSVGLMVVLHLFVMKTRMGKAMRAVSMDKKMAGMVGVDIDRVISGTFVIGSSLAAAAGIMISMYLSVIKFDSGYFAGLKAFTAAVLGGIGNIPGAMLGGILLGLAEDFTASRWSDWKDVVAFVILMLVLILKPRGLLGERVAEKV